MGYMPPVNKYKCNECSFSLQSGWGGYMYVIDENGERKACPHPDEPYLLLKTRTGFNSYCICLDCFNQFDLDIGDDEKVESSWKYSYGAINKRDERYCPKCNSPNVKTVLEMIGELCPVCRKGTIEEIFTGIIS